MEEKICIKCKELKSLNEYTRDSRKKDGTRNDCKSCVAIYFRERYAFKKQDPEWVLKENIKHRERKNRLGYYKKYKRSPEQSKDNSLKFIKKYPEKYKARKKSQVLESIFQQKHHWSYNEKHYLDIIELTTKNHNKAHRFLVYDQETFMYKTTTGELLDTKQKHIDYITEMINSQPD